MLTRKSVLPTLIALLFSLGLTACDTQAPQNMDGTDAGAVDQQTDMSSEGTQTDQQQ